MAAIKIKNRIDEIDINRITPMDALNLLYELKEIK
jgi:cell division protein ZapA (FtsZ GTPase activity inhibitor)